MAAQRGTPIGLVLVATIVVIGALLIWQPWRSGPVQTQLPSAEPSETPGPAESQPRNPVRDEAYKLQQQKEWCEAEKKWKKVIDSVDRQSPDHVEAQKNLDLVSRLCKPAKAPVTEVTIPAPPLEERPEEVSEEDVAKFYPVGRKIRSVAYLEMKGTGINEDWIFKGESHFVYVYQIVLETEVIENRGTAVVFEQRFMEVAQLRADSDTEIEFHLPESPLLEIAWEQLENNLLNQVPAYYASKKIAELVNVTDPRGRRLLTRLHKRLRRYGINLDGSEEIELVTRIENLSGLHIESEYVSGLGVTKIKVLDGQTFDPDDLERLAYNSSLLMDYFISRTSDRQDDEPIELQVRDVGSMVSFGYDLNADGSLSLRSDSQAEVTGVDEKILQIVGGELTLTGTVDGAERTGTVRPVSGYVRYRPTETLVREAKITWDANTSWVSTDHLLFGTKKIRNLKVESFYQAARGDEVAAKVGQ